MNGLTDISPTELESASGAIAFKANFAALRSADELLPVITCTVLVQHAKKTIAEVERTLVLDVQTLREATQNSFFQQFQ